MAEKIYSLTPDGAADLEAKIGAKVEAEHKNDIASAREDFIACGADSLA